MSQGVARIFSLWMSSEHDPRIGPRQHFLRTHPNIQGPGARSHSVRRSRIEDVENIQGSRTSWRKTFAPLRRVPENLLRVRAERSEWAMQQHSSSEIAVGRIERSSGFNKAGY